ncbi:MAG: four helix bundle protein [Gammaproteobacteria bacterium]|nr:four helix bundle protein [Gammaproteobacteria bacterium]
MEALRKLEVWRRACRLSANVYRLLATNREQAFRDQLSRSALSIASNIAEGYGRGSQRERVHFLRYARASCNEAWTQLHIGIDARIVDAECARPLADETLEIAKMIGGLIRYIESGQR